MSSCPYSQFERGSVSFCEADLCGWIVHPADTVSNLGYFIVAIVLFRLVKRDKKLGLFMLPVSALAVAIGSTLFHATNTFWGEFLDVSSMFMFSAFFIAKNAARLGLKRPKLLYWGVVIGSAVTLLISHPIGINLFIAQTVAWVVLEAVLWFKLKKILNGDTLTIEILNQYRLSSGTMVMTQYKPLIALGMVFAASYILWWVDQLGLVCTPDNHWFTWHSSWHLLNSWAFYYAYVFYKGIR